MERFVELVVAGGIALVVGLWTVRLAASRSAVWLGGVAVALLGLVALGVGIRRELSPDR
ncbi:hypothetical protein [Haloarcula sp. 1CSR25-25]|jgi:uncharacterized membrane protein|uniref:hypothetical protein n=1 Tax=Haloarcula sp. 1CSR25-25 TaxID=2862545 RepID=UPI002894465A|nr:hypothetical protein [Haloarcula sp. 1CSR25-25]MDT3436462.1 hypothetical protein [Haloarcula sp. 1CSR25-25]